MSGKSRSGNCLWRWSAASLVLLLSMPLWGTAQGFIIDTFAVQVDLNREGYFDVQEDIFVTFHESKHGIFRSIPYQYAWNDSLHGERASNRGEAGSRYSTPIVNIDVPGFDFATSTDGDLQQIRIGSSTKYVSGRVHYTIRYRVYGAINQFSDHDEFYWNITGNQWKVNIENTTFEIRLPAPLSPQDANARSWTGAVGETTSGAVFQFQGKGIKGHCPSRLLPGHGVTLGFSMPKGYLAIKPIPAVVMSKNYSIRNWDAVWTLQEDETWRVKESFTVDIRNAQSQFVRSLAYGVNPALLPDTNHLPGQRGMELIRAYENNSAQSPLSFRQERDENANPQLTYDIVNRGGQFSFTLEYRVWPGYPVREKASTLHLWEPTSTLLSEPAENVTFRLEAPKGIQPTDKWMLRRSGQATAPLQPRLMNGGLEFSLTDLLPGEILEGTLTLPAGSTQHSPTPLRLNCSDYYFPHYTSTLTFSQDGWATLEHDFALMLTSYYGDYAEDLPSFFWEARGNNHALPRYGLLRQHVRLRTRGPECSDKTLAPERNFIGHSVRWTLSSIDKGKAKHCRTQVGLQDLLIPNPNGGWDIFYPVLLNLPEPTDSAEVRLAIPHLPAKLLGQVTATALLTYGDSLTSITYPLTLRDGLLTTGTFGFYQGYGVTLKASLPAQAIAMNTGDKAVLLARDNRFLLLPVAILVILFPIWFFIGRDRKGVRMVQFYPPDNLSPTEAGLLVDDKLHNRDLLALFYYWAHQGTISIEVEGEGHTPRVTLVKIKDLPKNARRFERTLFQGIFNSVSKGGNRVKLNNLKYTFYTTMQKARNEVNLHAKTSNFYVPGTQAWKGWTRFAGWVLVLLATGALGSLAFKLELVERGRWEVPIGYLLAGVVTLAIGKRMLKRGPYGAKAYDHLMGFKEFIEKADKDRLEKLLEKDHAYFGHTLSYAIAFGMANKWVAKFDHLLAAAPEWYQTDHHQGTAPFDADRMNRELTAMLSTMSTTLNSTPPKTTGSGSTWTNRGSGGSSYSSSSSSSSYSGGGGSYSSGGYSGGGYGGGGGGSW